MLLLLDNDYRVGLRGEPIKEVPRRSVAELDAIAKVEESRRFFLLLCCHQPLHR
jgi:hypothetical protein